MSSPPKHLSAEQSTSQIFPNTCTKWILTFDVDVADPYYKYTHTHTNAYAHNEQTNDIIV